MKQKKYPYTTWRGAKPGGIVYMTNEEMKERINEVFDNCQKDNKTHMKLVLETEVKESTCVLRLERLNDMIWLVAKKDGYDHYLCTISDRGIERTQIMTSSGFKVDSSYRINLVGE